MKTFTTILTLFILIGCGPKNQEQNQTADRIEVTSESDRDTQIQKMTGQKEIELDTKCDCEGFVDWQKDVQVKLFDQPNGLVIDTLTHDYQLEDFLTFTIYDIQDDFFKVRIGRDIEGQNQKGWIKMKPYLGLYARNYSDSDTLYLFSEPDLKSRPNDTINKYYPKFYTVTNCEGKWAKVILKTRNKEFTGWIQPRMQCSSPYTTCN